MPHAANGSSPHRSRARRWSTAESPTSCDHTAACGMRASSETLLCFTSILIFFCFCVLSLIASHLQKHSENDQLTNDPCEPNPDCFTCLAGTTLMPIRAFFCLFIFIYFLLFIVFHFALPSLFPPHSHTQTRVAVGAVYQPSTRSATRPA
jgi:hypothetical protein